MVLRRYCDACGEEMDCPVGKFQREKTDKIRRSSGELYDYKELCDICATKVDVYIDEIKSGLV